MSHVSASTLFLSLLSLSVLAQARVMNVDRRDPWKHRITPRPVIHEVLPQGYNSLWISVTVVVTASGQVESAAATNDFGQLPKWATDQAEAAEKLQRFAPFKGWWRRPVRATFEDTVWIVPPVEWAFPHQPFPEVHDRSTLRIKLNRTHCYGVCPVYSIEIRGDGELLFDGQEYVPALGHQRGRISSDEVSALLAAFRRADYFSLKDEYVALITDLPSCTTSIEFDGKKKSVKDYVGFAAGMPDVVYPLEKKIDDIARAQGWIR